MTTDWYAPNQQAVRPDGSGPAEEGTGGSGEEPPVADQPDQADQTDQAGDDLDSLTKEELIEVASERGIDVNASMTKAEIREAIEAG